MELGLTRGELAERMKTTRMTVWRVEKGKQKVAADNQDRADRADLSLRAWAEALETSPAELVA